MWWSHGYGVVVEVCRCLVSLEGYDEERVQPTVVEGGCVHEGWDGECPGRVKLTRG